MLKNINKFFEWTSVVTKLLIPIAHDLTDVHLSVNKLQLDTVRLLRSTRKRYLFRR